MRIYLLLFVFSISLVAAEQPETKRKIRYRSGKAVQLDETQIQGDMGRPDIAVVTGEGGENDNGLLRLRKNFDDRIVLDGAGELK